MELDHDRATKIKKLNERIAVHKRNEMHLTGLIGKSQFSQESLEECIKDTRLEIQAYELLLYKVLKGDRK